MVISVKALSGASAADYYLQRDAGCEADYYLDPASSAGSWLGRGSAELGLTGPLDEAGELAFRRLLAGHHPGSGEQLAKPVWRPAPAGRLRGAPLVTAIGEVAAKRGLTDPADLFGDARLADTFRGVAAASDRRPFTRALDPRVGQRLAAAVGIDPAGPYRTDDGSDAFADALTHAADRYDARNSAYDVCVSAPKSVSTLWALADPSTAAAIETAHAEAVDAAMRYLERTCGHGLRGHQGDKRRATRIGTGGFVAAAFGHRTSRANDPQLHTHVVVANLLHGRDGRWSAIDSRSLYRHATTASYIYHAALRGELSASLGVGWSAVTKGIAEITGIPTELMQAFSTRRGEIENYLTLSGRDDPAAAQYACLATRPDKLHRQPGELRAEWRQTARELGHRPDDIVTAALTRTDVAALDVEALTATLTGPEGLTRRKTTVDQRDVIQALCEALPPGTPVTLASLDRLAREVTESTNVVPLRTDTDGGPRFSTTELLATEQDALAVAERLRGSPATETSDTLPPLEGLTDEQRELAVRLVRGTSRLEVIVGAAGSGKTSALGAAYRNWRAAHVPVIGTAVAALAARGLQSRTGIPSVTLTRLLADLDEPDPRTGHPAGFAPGTVVIVDEASMVDTRSYARLLEHVSRSGARLALVGDTEQLPEIDAGGLFATLAADPSTIRLTANVRQQSDWERDALTALRENRPAAALLAYLAHDRVHVDDARRLPAAITGAYTAGATAAPLGTVVLASTRRQVAALNAAIRARLVRDGHVAASGMPVQAGGRTVEFAVGDVVVITRNRRPLGVLNGMRGQITRVNARTGGVVMTDDLGEQHVLPRDVLVSGDVQHGYALTIHRAQGITVDTALVYGTATLSREAGYVALSRGRVANHLYASPDDMRDAAGDGPFDRDSQDLLTTVEQLALRLSVTRRQQLATSSLSPRPAYPDRGYPQPTREVRGVSR